MTLDTMIEIKFKYTERMFFKRARSLWGMFFKLCEECSYSGLGDLKAWPVLLVYSDMILHIGIPKHENFDKNKSKNRVRTKNILFFCV